MAGSGKEGGAAGGWEAMLERARRAGGGRGGGEGERREEMRGERGSGRKRRVGKRKEWREKKACGR